MKHTLLTVSQAAKLRGVSRAAVYLAIAQKRLRHSHTLGHLVVREADVIAWGGVAGAKRGRPKGNPLSPEHKARIAEAQKKRWAKRKNESDE